MNITRLLPAKCLAGLTAILLVCASMPATQIYAEGETEAVTEEITTEAAEPESTVLVITGFPKLAQDSDWNFKDPDIQKKYGNLCADAGTPMDDLGLPAKISVSGYLESDGPDAAQDSIKLENMIWKVRGDDASYSESSPAGTYTFSPDFDAYAENSEQYDEIRLAEDLKSLRITVTIADAAQTEPETESIPEPEPEPEPEPVPEPEPETHTENIVVPEPEINTESIVVPEPEPDTEMIVVPEPEPDTEMIIIPEPEPDTEMIIIPEPEPDTEMIIIPEPETQAADTSNEFIPEITESDIYTETEPLTESDIFQNIDDSLIGADGEIVIYDTEPVTEAYTEPVTEAYTEPVTEAYTEPVTEMFTEAAPEPTPMTELLPEVQDVADFQASSELQASSESQVPSESQAPSESQVPSEAETSAAAGELTETETETETEAYTEPETEPEAPELSITFAVTDGTHSQGYISAQTGSNILTLNTEPKQGENSAALTLSCGSAMDMSSVFVSFANAQTGATLAYAPDGAAQDFTDGAPAKNYEIYYTVTREDGSQITYVYPFTLTVSRQKHTWGAKANCTTAMTCTVCGAVGEEALGHDWQPATCTRPSTCSRCGSIDGEALGHDWAEATCTKPKTCKRCGAEEGKALGHLMYDNWEVVSESVYTVEESEDAAELYAEHGEEIRYCQRKGCDHSETRPLNIIGVPEDNTILGLSDGASYDLRTTLTFRASGAAMGNTKPINGDVRYVPASWMVQNTPGTFRDNFTGAFAITQSGRYTLTVTFQKQVYKDGWQVTDIADSKSLTITVGNVISAIPADGSSDAIRINPRTGDDTPIAPLIAALAAAAAVIAGAVFYRKKKK